MTLRYKEPPKKKPQRQTTAPKKTGKMGKSDCPEPKAKPKAKPTGPSKLPAPKPKGKRPVPLPSPPKSKGKRPVPMPRPPKSKDSKKPVPMPRPRFGEDFLDMEAKRKAAKRLPKQKTPMWGQNMLAEAIKKRYKRKKK